MIRFCIRRQLESQGYDFMAVLSIDKIMLSNNLRIRAGNSDFAQIFSIFESLDEKMFRDKTCSKASTRFMSSNMNIAWCP
jgi:hypothetical protein